MRSEGRGSNLLSPKAVSILVFRRTELLLSVPEIELLYHTLWSRVGLLHIVIPALTTWDQNEHATVVCVKEQECSDA